MKHLIQKINLNNIKNLIILIKNLKLYNNVCLIENNLQEKK